MSDRRGMVGPGLRGRFVASMAREMMKDVMRERLKEEKYNVDRAAKATREIADSIKTKLKEFHWERYKYVVQVVIGEQRGEGIQMGCRCFWDEDADNFAQASYSNDSLFATAVAFGVYLY